MPQYTGPVRGLFGQSMVCEECLAVGMYANVRAWDATHNRSIECKMIATCPTPGCSGNIAERMEKTCDAEMQWQEFMARLWPS